MIFQPLGRAPLGPPAPIWRTNIRALLAAARVICARAALANHLEPEFAWRAWRNTSGAGRLLASELDDVCQLASLLGATDKAPPLSTKAI